MQLIEPWEIAEDRALAEAQMVDRVRITRPGDGERTRDPDTLQYTDPEPVIVYEGRGRVQVRADINSNAVEGVVAEHESTYRTGTLQLPMEPAPGEIGHPGDVRTDYTATVLESPYDETRVGLVMNVQADTKSKTHATSRKFRTRELLS